MTKRSLGRGVATGLLLVRLCGPASAEKGTHTARPQQGQIVNSPACATPQESEAASFNVPEGNITYGCQRGYLLVNSNFTTWSNYYNSDLNFMLDFAPASIWIPARSNCASSITYTERSNFINIGSIEHRG